MTDIYEYLQNVPDEAVAVAAPKDYVDGGGSLMPEGTYNFVIKEFRPEFSEDGTFQNRISLTDCRVTGVPSEELRTHLRRKLMNLSIWTTTYKRNGITVSGLGDLIRGIDPDRSWVGLKDAVDIIQEAVDQQINIQARLVWAAFDKKGWEMGGGKFLSKGTQEYKELRNRVSVKGMRNFPPLPDGSFKNEVTGPISNEVLEGRLEIASVINAEKQRDMITE
jgi:hypothetical protein